MTLVDTQERALPLHQGQAPEDYLVYLKHVALYDYAKSFSVNKFVLDLGCGEGYGSASLAAGARFVVSADYSFEAVAHAKAKYACENQAFVVCDAQTLPFSNAAFEQVISFEVIEHIPNVKQYLREMRRVLVHSGSVMVSTPNRLLRLLPFQKPWNRFHLREYDVRGLTREMRSVFQNVQVLGITAIPEILAIEKRRVKQNPFIAYPRMIAQSILPSPVYTRLRKFKYWLKRFRIARQSGGRTEQYSVDDFQISGVNLNDCINLVGLVRL